MILKIGTSGWQYRSWRGPFYPNELPQRSWLQHYASNFGTVEVNSVFYRLPERETFAAWARQTPEGFTMAVKASRYLTHLRRLREPQEPVDRLVDRLEGLGSRRGPVLLQLPPDFRAAPDRLDETLACFPEGMRVAVELRHPSWFVDQTWELLSSRGAAFCLVDRRGPKAPLHVTASWTYLRLHEGRASPSPCYGRKALESWLGRLEDLCPPGGDAYVMFNNDERCCAVHDASLFASLAEAAGLTVAGPRDG